MLQKFGVPTGHELIAVAPVQYKFGDLLLRKFQIDIGEFEHIVNILARLPIIGDTLGFGVVFQCGVIAQPLAFNVLDEFAVPGAAHIAALLPIDNKFRNGIFDKR